MVDDAPPERRSDIDVASVIVPEIILVGSICGRFAPALKLLKDGKIDLQFLIKGDYQLKDAKDAFATPPPKAP